MTTFSACVDSLVTELYRPDLLAAFAAYLNQTVREMHFRPNMNAPILFDANRNEDEITQTQADAPLLWALPSVTRFQGLESAYCPELGMYIPARNPRVSLTESFEPFNDVYYYRGGNVIAFSGIPKDATVQLTYHLFPRSLTYKVVADRVVVYNADTESYDKVGGGTPTVAELDAETHWLLQRWDSVISEGVRSKVWRRLGDMDRTRTSYSAFESMRAAIWNSEPSSN